jgi:signal peptidase II
MSTGELEAGRDCQAPRALAAPPAASPSLLARRLELSVAAVIVVADQIAKALVLRHLPLHETVSIVPGVLNLTHVRNTGAAFGFLNAADFPYKGLVITVMAALALVAIAVYASRLAPHEHLVRLGLALILGGAVGNLIDRASAGYVVDFVDVYWRDWHFWAFNVADAAITVGAGLMILDMLGVGTHVSKTR